MEFGIIIELVGRGVDVAGVALIVIGAAWATGRFLLRLLRRQSSDVAYRRYREGLGHTLLLGLEFLVAADIIRTVAVTPTFEQVGVLAVIVVIRTFLSWSLELEIEGRWPWQQRRTAPDSQLPRADK
ncbi:MAG: DUF1622 domain-containing protein [Roseiflexaceae bacterium]